jgi:hypothetical protein
VAFDRSSGTSRCSRSRDRAADRGADSGGLRVPGGRLPRSRDVRQPISPLLGALRRRAGYSAGRRFCAAPWDEVLRSALRNGRGRPADEKPLSVHDLSVHARMLGTPCGQVDANLHPLRTLVRGREEKHFKLGFAERVGKAAALAKIVREVGQGDGIADSDPHDDRLRTLAAWRQGTSSLQSRGRRGAAPHCLPRRTAGPA